MAGSCGSRDAHTWVPGCGATEALSFEAAAREDRLSFREALGSKPRSSSQGTAPTSVNTELQTLVLQEGEEALTPSKHITWQLAGPRAAATRPAKPRWGHCPANVPLNQPVFPGLWPPHGKLHR